MISKQVKIYEVVIIKDMLLVTVPGLHERGCMRCARKLIVPYSSISCFDFPVCKQYKFINIRNVEFILIRRIGKEA